MTVNPPSDSVADDAYELFMAEAARLRLVERSGDARISLRSGAVLAGAVVTNEDQVDGFVQLRGSDGRSLHVSTEAVTVMVGASVTLRHESDRSSPRSLASRLRESWTAGGRVRALMNDGRWIDGVIVLVASDHADLSVGPERWAVAYSAVEAWDLSRNSRQLRTDGS